MRSITRIVAVVSSVLAFSSFGHAATVTGTVKGPDGAPFMGAFVIAENSQNKMSVSVLSDKQGHYHCANLPAATYAVRIRAIGYNSDPRTGVHLSGDQKATFDFALRN